MPCVVRRGPCRRRWSALRRRGSLRPTAGRHARGGALAQADVDKRDAEGRTALHWAASRQRVEIVGLLLDANADADLQNEAGATPGQLAAAQGHAQLAEMLGPKAGRAGRKMRAEAHGGRCAPGLLPGYLPGPAGDAASQRPPWSGKTLR